MSSRRHAPTPIRRDYPLRATEKVVYTYQNKASVHGLILQLGHAWPGKTTVDQRKWMHMFRDEFRQITLFFRAIPNADQKRHAEKTLSNNEVS